MQRRLETYLKHIPIPGCDKANAKVLADALTAMHETRQHTAQPGRMTWRTIMMSRASRLIAAALVVGVVLFAFFDSFTQPAWALQDAIEALKDFKAIYMVGAFPGATAEIWMRTDKAKTRSTDVVIKSSQGTIWWTRDGSTYHYEPSQNTVYFENALTIGAAQWLGPGLLEMFSNAENTQILRGKDPATGRDRVTLMCSLIDVHGAQSWVLECDAATKLPVAVKQWPNLDRSGPPSFDTYRITYYEDLPDSLFDVHIPADAKRVEKPLQIPAETVGALTNPQHGISVEGMTQQEAAEKAVRMLYEAVIEQDVDRLKNICPLCQNWGDKFLRAIVFRPDKEDRTVAILKIGQISKTGQSPLGPIVAVPATVRLKNGKKAEQQMIVQFRERGGKSSCVVHGPYGLPREVE
jgi:hypothetical protein